MSKKILWFLRGPASAEQMALAKSVGMTIRDPNAYRIGDFIEQADGVAGDAPAAYLKAYELIEMLRADGPTVVEFVAAGYLAANYPPEGYESRSTAQEIADAIAEQDADSGADGKMPIAKLREILTEKGVTFDPKAKKADLQALLDQTELAAKIAGIKAQLTDKAIAFEDAATLEELEALNTPSV